MKTLKLSRLLTLISLACFGSSFTSNAAVYDYFGNGRSDGGGGIGQGSLTLSDSGSTIRATVHLGGTFPTSYANYLVLYIDSRPGGFSDNMSFFDNKSTWTRTVSGYSAAGSRAAAYFAPNFGADYAIVLSRTVNGAALYELVSGSTLPAPKMLSFTDNSTSWQFSFSLSDIGATSPSFKFQSSATSSTGSGYRYLESYETTSGTMGFGTVTFGNYNTFGVEAVPETANAALAVFGGLVVAAGAGSRLRRCFRRRA